MSGVEYSGPRGGGKQSSKTGTSCFQSSPSAALGSACALPTCLVPQQHSAPQRLLFAHLLLSYRGASGQARLAAWELGAEERRGSGEMSEGAGGGQPGSEQTASVDVDHIGAEMPPNEVTTNH